MSGTDGSTPTGSRVLDAAARARFESLCAQFRPDVYRFAFWLARDRTLAEDVVQETFMRAWR